MFVVSVWCVCVGLWGCCVCVGVVWYVVWCVYVVCICGVYDLCVWCMWCPKKKEEGVRSPELGL